MRTPPWSFVQYVNATHPAPRAGIQAGEVIYDVPDGIPTTVLEIVRQWRALEARLHDIEVDRLTRVHDGTIVAPLTYPSKLLCAGANYYDHAEEMGTGRPDPDAPPFFFLKPPTTTVVGPNAEVAIPTGTDPRVDWEVELAVVIADRISHVTEADALSHVAGYTVANDLSARGLFHRDDAVSPPFAWDWLAHKAFDGSCPLGPGIVPAWLVPDPDALQLQLRVNGELKQNSSTASLVAGIARLISAASRTVTLEPGDVILTGTPAGVGMPRNEFLSAGDRVDAEIDGVGTLTNTLVAR